jgi:hypothetical protein
VNVGFYIDWTISFLLGLAVPAVGLFIRTRVRRRRLRHFFGQDALEAGVSVALSVLDPLTEDQFAPDEEERTMAFKTFSPKHREKWPIYGRTIHLADQDAFVEVRDLLRHEGAKDVRLVPDYEALGKWDEAPCVVCLGSPFVNAAFIELLQVRGEDPPFIDADRPRPTLDSYRVSVREPKRLLLGVDEDNGIGVIVRLPNPARPRDSVVGVWGCRAESTRTAARYFRQSFKQVAGWVERGKPLVVLLAVRGSKLDVPRPMYVATDRIRTEVPNLLDVHRRDE